MTLKALLKRTQQTLSAGLALAIVVHAALTQLRGLTEERKTLKPLTSQFVKRQPRLTKPLELKKRPQPKRRQVQRKTVAVKARIRRAQDGVRFEPAKALGNLATPAAGIGRIEGFASSHFEPASVSSAMEGTKETEQKIDMSLELLDIEALDTGQYHALVVCDPQDKRGIKGFCRLSLVYSSQFFWPPRKPGTGWTGCVGIGLRRLAMAMNDLTDIKTEVLGRVTLTDKALLKAPWVLFSPNKVFQLSAAQRCALGEYLLAGGFVFADGQDHPSLQPQEWKAAFRSLRVAIVESLKECGAIATIQTLPNTHAIYHCYFDFGGPPAACDLIHHHNYPDQAHVVGSAEGIEVEGRLLTFITGKGYGEGWTIMGPGGVFPTSFKAFDDTPAFRFGVNTIVFALTQEGSITHRLMESVGY